MGCLMDPQTYRFGMSRGCILEFCQAHDLPAHDVPAQPVAAGQLDEDVAPLPWEVQQHLLPVIQTLGAAALREQPVDVHRTQPTAHIDDLMSKLSSLDFDSLDLRTRFIFLRYNFGNTDIAGLEVQRTLSSQLEAKNAHICVGRHDLNAGDTIVLVRFGNYRRFSKECLKVKDVLPDIFKVDQAGTRPAQRAENILNALKAFAASLAEFCGDMQLTEASQEWNIDSLANLVGQLTEAQLLKLKGDAQLVPKDERTPFQKAFLTAFETLQRLLKQQKGALDIPSIIRPGGKLDPKLSIKDLINLDQLCSRYNEVTGEYDVITLKDYIKNAKIFLTYALILLGPNGTTGFGKTQAAITISLFWVSKFVRAGHLREDDAAVVLHMI